MIANQPSANNFESEIKSVLDFDYVVDERYSRSSYSAMCDDVLIPFPDDEGLTKKQIAWELDLMQNTFEINIVVPRSNTNDRMVWIGRGDSARAAYTNLVKVE